MQCYDVYEVNTGREPELMLSTGEKSEALALLEQCVGMVSFFRRFVMLDDDQCVLLELNHPARVKPPRPRKRRGRPVAFGNDLSGRVE